MQVLSFIHSWIQIKSAFVALKRLPSYFAFVVCILLPSQSYAFEQAGIEVSGQGSVVVIPDQFSITLTITERGRLPSKLKALVDKKSNLVVNAAKNLAVKETNISSARVNLRIVVEKPSIQVQGIELHKARQANIYIDGQTVNQQTNKANLHKQPLFELSRQITVKFNELADYDSFLTQIIKIKVSHISSLSMTVAGQDEFYQQALLKAISHAQQKAQRMVKQAGRSLGQILLLKELASNHYRPMYAEAMMSDASPRAHTSLIGSQTITARVLVKFSLED
ncbi:hypothetical protein CMT41_08235 [Colwellia sp. MT41]|uniref:SIMPL domain-containing protein n=1 Tax=Colwellia sp. MT41 TaxID=58049 RepID=UPI000717A72D|nr:SIMPL domain-containing protein [Colwellia sp. MT41]ALO34703.1 hypothetical protein CMT41_08235 [Colwellia sp. MT41]